MATLKEVLLKIEAIKKTRQITKAMNMVAASRLRGAQTAMEGFRPYAGKFAEVLGSLAQKAGGEASALLIPRESVKKVNVALCTSDRGLCGGFNANLIETAEKYVAQKYGSEVEISFTNFGKKGADWARKEGLSIAEKHLGVVGSVFGFNVASTTGRKLVNGFLEGDYDEVVIVYAEFVSVAKQVPTVKQLLPIPPIEVEDSDTDQTQDQAYQAEHICEPSAEELLGDLLPRNVFVQIHNALLETSTSEHAARMMAMDNATQACKDMLETLTVAYNRARQAAITADLMDIVGGAEALKG